jgi:cytochrome bd-type quinol oxidase subunit 2
MRRTVVKSIIAFLVLTCLQALCFLLIIRMDRPDIVLNSIRNHVKYIQIDFVCFLGISCIFFAVDSEHRYLPLSMIYFSVLGLLGLFIIGYGGVL